MNVLKLYKSSLNRLKSVLNWMFTILFINSSRNKKPKNILVLINNKRQYKTISIDKFYSKKFVYSKNPYNETSKIFNIRICLIQ